MPKQAETKPSKQKSAAKQPGFKVTIRGQVALKEDRGRDIKLYEEEFVLSNQYRDWALMVIVRCLLPYRLKIKYANFGHVRTHEIKGGITAVEDTGFSTLEAKPLWDLDSEELRLFVLLKDVKIPEMYYDQDAKKQKVRRYIQATELARETPIDFDLKDKLAKFFESDSPKEEGVGESEEQEEPKKEKWENLD